MSFKDYYQSELTALRQHAARLCERQPVLNTLIGQDRRDPDVERVLQGTSFLTARLRQTLDDEFPEITHALVQRLWPDYLRPMPSMSVIQFDPSSRAGPARHIPRHCEVTSSPIQGINCQFKTVFDTQVIPLELYRLEHADSGKGAILKLSMKVTAGGHIAELDLQQLRLHLAGETSIRHQLYRGLLQQLSALRITLLDTNGVPLPPAGQPAHITLKPTQISAVGFDDEEALLNSESGPQRGYRLLQEYFVFKDKFLFVDVLGLDAINRLDKELLGQACGMELRFEFSRYPKPAARPLLENVKLHCAPVINLFSHKAIPVAIEAGQHEYPLLPGELDKHACEIFGIHKVVGWQPGQLSHREYVSPEFKAKVATLAQGATRPLYRLSQQLSILDDSVMTTLCLNADDSADETIAVDLTCTNRNLPRQLAVGDICLPGKGVPELLTFQNICPATASHATPRRGEHLWKLISNMSLNYLSLQDVNALKEILRTYDLPAFHDHGARIDSDELFGALHKVSHQNIDYLIRGVPTRGTRTLLEIRPKDAGCEAQWYLFGSVLSHFFALYASHHSFNQLHIQSSSGELWSWDVCPGQQPTL